MDEDSSAKDNSDDDIHEGIEDSSADDSDDDDLHSLPSLVERCPDDDSDSDDDSLPSLMERRGWNEYDLDSDDDDSDNDEPVAKPQRTRGQGTEVRWMDQQPRMIAPVTTVRIGSFAALDEYGEGRTELDSHADTCVVGHDTALVIQDFGRQVTVHGYMDDIGSAKCKTMSAVVAYDHPETGDTFMLVIHQAILIPKMKTNLLCPMQLRDNDVQVNDEPKHMALNPANETHAITFMGTEEKEALQIPLLFKGVVSYFPTRKPTVDEWEKSGLSKQIELTAEAPEWDPSTSHFEEQEANMLDANGKLRDEPIDWSAKRIVAALNTLPQAEPIDCHLGQALERNVRVALVSSYRSNATEATSVNKVVKTKAKAYPITAKQLARNWNVSLQKAERTIEVTTQNGVRTLLHPTLSRRFRTNDRQL